MQRSTDGSPAYSERRASLWQYWQSILYVPTCTLCGKLMGWTEGFASAAHDWRLHDEIARKIRTARSTTPSAPTAALPLIDSRSPSEGLNDACEAYHAVYGAVNLFGRFPAQNEARANAVARASPGSDGGERLGRGAPGQRDVGVGVSE